MNDADQSGFILVRPFVAQLQKFEKAEPAMSYYFPDLIAAIDVPAEQKRLQNVKFSPENPAPAPKPETEAEASLSDLDRLLAQGDRQIAVQDAAGAAATFENILAKYPGQPKAEYGLAIASVMAGNGERAEQLFSKLVAPASAASGTGNTGNANGSDNGDAVSPGRPDATILSWSHVYLGRICDLKGEREAAVHEYLGALAVNGAPEAARVAAQRGMDMPYKSHARADTNGKDNGSDKNKVQQQP